jgi:glycosyltransferase involved in cell wall biosynthesis
VRILHLIDRIGPGGPIRSLLAAIACGPPPGTRHRLLALAGPPYMPLAFKARRAGLDVTLQADLATARGALAAADVVLVHWWSTPALWTLLAGPLPPVPIALWVKVAGAHPPQLLTRTLLDRVDRAVLTAPAPPALRGHPAIAPETVVPGLVEPERLERLPPQPHRGLVAACIGTLNRGKMHPDLIELLAAIEPPDLQVQLAGGLDPELRAQIAATGAPERFVDLGFREDVPAILAGADLFAYPLAQTGYASSDKALQEAMLQAVAPVVLAGSAPARFVVDGETGIVAGSPQAFVERCSGLLADPATRRRLGENARDWARSALDPQPAAATLWRAVVAAAGAGARPRDPWWPDADLRTRGAALAACALGCPDAPLATDLGAPGDVLRDWAATLPDAAFEVEGGLVHFLEHFPGDLRLRTWVEDRTAARRAVCARGKA